MATTNSATKVVTERVRLSYVHVFEPYTSDPDKDEAKYSVTILIPKTDKITIKRLRDAQQAALEAGKAKLGGKIPPNWIDTIHDGDEEADLEKNPEYEHHWYMAVSAKTKPGVVDQYVKPILDSTEVYSGCYARVSINAFAFSNKGKKGVSFGLNHVQKMADGDFLGGRSKAEDDFDAVEVDEDDVL